MYLKESSWYDKMNYIEHSSMHPFQAIYFYFPNLVLKYLLKINILYFNVCILR